MSQALQREESAAERLVKVAYLFQFSSWVEWPDNAFTAPDRPLRIGVLAADDLAAQLTGLLQNRPAQGRPVTVTRLSLNSPRTGIHILFVGASARNQLQELSATLRKTPVLIVTDIDQGLDLGSMINFLVVDGKLRFEIAPERASQAGLVISSRLLRVSYKLSASSPKFRTE